MNETDKKKEKDTLLKPGQPRVTITDSADYAGKHPTPSESGPDIVKPGTGGQAEGQTTRS